ncbi:hypothetical protein J2X11_002303 [Aeromicrobium panaciterrae]|uniref:Uncharacterized protein n=1 Tax=Aeromicrobium panaciterrae TaxID=363861 RepID=A0ABU1UQK0_9ACTN|nr:hypothetical protein [Aeromicrobium panaciterrae]MDR7087464.1 hypothetical protein [Aeromicrobium panaciterrae]
MSARPVPVPRVVTIAYVVLTAQPLDREDLVPLPERSLLRLRGSTVKDLNRMSGLSYQRLVSRSVSAGAARLAAEEALQEALTIADEHDGLVVDLQTPRVADAPETSPRPASALFTFEYDLQDVTTIRTHGLNVLGLPEIMVRDVPEDKRQMYDMVVVGLVHRLLDEWPQHDPVGPARVTLGDIAAGYDGGDTAATEQGVGILIDYDATEHLLDVSLIDDPATLFGN